MSLSNDDVPVFRLRKHSLLELLEVWFEKPQSWIQDFDQRIACQIHLQKGVQFCVQKQLSEIVRYHVQPAPYEQCSLRERGRCETDCCAGSITRLQPGVKALS